jgi:acetylornithine deacetylase/succinyl-diaminopimelate desuccinylase-like protein
MLLDAVRAALRARVPLVPEGMSLDVRFTSERQRAYTGWEEDRVQFSPGFLMPPDDPVVLAAAAAAGRRGSPTTPAAVRPWTFATDGGFSHGLHGIPTIGFAPGEERFAHTNRERLEVDEARWALARYPDVVQAAQEALRG